MSEIISNAKGLMFIVGKEREHAVSLLFKFFTQAILQERWEVAKACLHQLHVEGNVLDIDTKKILRQLISHPYDKCDFGREIPTPHHLSWLCLLQYRKLLSTVQEENEEKKAEVEWMKDGEFNLLLFETCRDASSSLIKELYQYYRLVSNSGDGLPTLSNVQALSSSLQDHLQRSLREDPILGNAVILYLLVPGENSAFKKNNETLHSLYLLAVNDLLDNLSAVQNGDTPIHIKKIYHLLSLYNPESYQNYELLRSLFGRVFELSSMKDGLIDRTLVLSSLVGRSHDYLVKEFCSYEFEIETKRTGLSLEIRGGDFSEDQQRLLHISGETIRSQQLLNFFLLCLKRKQHLLSTVIETSLNLIKHQMFKDLQKLLSVPELCPLRPLVLLLGWTVCHSVNDARRLLQVLWDDKWCCLNPLIERGCSKLAYQIDLIQWCLEKTKPLLSPTDSSALTHQQRAAAMFHCLENHSVLYVLHHSTKIGSLDQEEVLKLLRKSPQSEKEEDKKPKSVRFAEDDETKEQSRDIHIEQHRDISIYSGYCAIKQVMDAIYYCAENNNEQLMNPVQRKYRYGSRHDSFSKMTESNSSEESLNGSNFQKEYRKNVTERLHLAKEYISRLQPLTYRVEVIENIFSLLFVTHENIQESAYDVESDSGEIELEEDERPRSETVAKDDSFRTNSTADESTSPTSPAPLEEIELIVSTKGTATLAYDEPFPEPVVAQTKSRKRSTSLTDLLVNQRKESFSSRISQIKAEELQQKACGNCSTLSGDSASSYLRFGLLCNEYLIRDILAMIKDCMVDLSAARYQFKGQSTNLQNSWMKTSVKEASALIDVNLEEHLSSLVASSVTKDTLGKRVTQLSQYVNEAFWRFQLVCHEKIPRTPGEVLMEPIVVYLEEEDEGMIRSLILNDDTGGGQKKLSVSSSASNSRSSPIIDPENTKHGNKGEGLRKKRSRSKSQQRKSGHQSSSKHLGIISTMLSSPETLLCMCIRKNNLMQAAEVIKLLRLENRSEALEVKFAEVYNSCAKRLQGLHIGNHGSPSKTNKPGKMTLKALGTVAAAGVANVSISSITDELLRETDLPKVPNVRSIVASKLISLMGLDDIPSSVLFDLLCTSCRTWEMCNNMVDILKTNLVGDSKKSLTSSMEKTDEQKGRQDGRVQGIRDFLSLFESLLQLGSESSSGTVASEVKDIYILLYKHSISTFLQTASLPLSPPDCMAYATLITEMKKAMEKVEHTFQLHGRMPLEGYHNRSPPKASPRASPKASPRSEDLGHSNQPVLHNAMKQLILVMQRDLPPGGISSHLSGGNSSQNFQVNRDYLQNLYDHLKRLAFVVMESESKSKETMVTPKNYFRMLDEGPINILGRLMFSLKLYPAKLEAVAKALSLNLTHIIVHSCCVKIPSKHQIPSLRERGLCVQERSLPKTDTNCDKVEGSLNPDEAVRNILTRLLHLMKDIASKNSAKSIFDVACAKLLLKLPGAMEVFAMIPHLQGVDLELLKTKEEKLCFFANLQNLMFIHMCLDLIWKSMVNVECKTPDMEENGLDTEVKLFSEMTVLEQIVYLSVFSYEVGQLGKISLFDVKYLMNHSGLSPPAEFGDLLNSRLSELSQDDLWSKYAPKPEPRLLFVLTTCTESSPPVQVLMPELIKTQIQQGMKDYLNHSITVDVTKNTITMPELLMWYKHDFSTEVEEFSAENEGILHVIQEHTSGEVNSALEEMLKQDEVHDSESIDSTGRKELPFKVGIESFKTEFMVTFGYEKDNGKAPGFKKSHRRVNSLPKNIHLSVSHSGSSENKDTLYQLSPCTLEYIKSECPLVATLVSLVCTDELDEIEEHLTDDYFSASLRSRSSSEMSLVDIRSYRYQKLTDDYPLLKRHIVNYVIPIAGAEEPEILKSGDPLLKFITSNISEKVKACMLNLHDSQQFQDVLMKMLNDLLSHGKWTQIIDILDSLPNVILLEHKGLCTLHDFVIVCFINETVRDKPHLSKVEGDKVVKYIRKFLSKDMKFHTLLSCHRSLPLEHNLHLFEMSCFDKLSEEKLSIMKEKLSEMRMHYRITACAKTLQVKLSARRDSFMVGETKGDYHTVLDKIMDWRNLLSHGVVSPDEVLAVLLRTGDYDTARLWCKHVKFSRQQYLNVIEHQLITLLEEQPSNTTKAFLVLEEIRATNGKDCLHVCHKMLDKLTNQNDVLFILNYMLDQLKDLLQNDIEEKLSVMQVGARMLLCLPSSLHPEYCHLIRSPKLILEQLLMNMKIDLAGKSFQMVHIDLTTFTSPEQRYSQQDFNKLLTAYAKKALDLSGIVMETVKERSQSEASTASSDKVLDRGTPDMLRHTSKRMSLTESLRPGSNRFLSPTPTPSPLTLGSSVKLEAGAARFVMPPEPPPKEKWQPDTATDTCMVCKTERFSMFNRRHHCRRCGRVVCSSCSTKTSPIHGVLARTCDDCYSQIYNSSKTEADVYRPFTGGDNTPGASPLTRPFSPSPSNYSLSDDSQRVSLANTLQNSPSMWKLKADTSEHNEMTREEFYYEQAPSTSLCLSILELHSHPVTSGQLMLSLCDSLSQYLKPLAPGVPNPEVDYSLILSMMKALLFHAKMKFSASGESQSLARCEVYQSHIDLLAVLTTDNYSDLPSLQELTKKDFVMRLRDKLIQDERLQLAVEVSTKCGLDTAGVWGAWGMNCLMAGDYVGAKEKYARCLKVICFYSDEQKCSCLAQPPQDRNAALPMPKHLKDIMDYLETMPAAGPSQLHFLMTKSLSWQDLLTTHVSVSEDCSSDSLQFQECLYYLKTYGTYSHVIDFHRRNGRWMKAVQFLLDKKCSSEVYMKSLLVPALTSGELGKLTDQMVMIDPTLEKWHLYLTATCRYLLNHRYHVTLYDFQLFMKDFIRAAMTCITCFYQKGAQSYLDLNYRVKHLHDAIHHMQAFLDPKEWGMVRPIHLTSQPTEEWKKSSEGVVRLVMTKEEITKYTRSISLQIEVTKYLANCLTHSEGEAAMMAMQYVGSLKSTQLPTLFGTSRVKADLVTMVLLSGSDINAAFELGYRIIKEYRLGAATIFTHVAREMAKNKRYNHIGMLLDCVNQAGLGDDDTVDEIVGACILVIADKPSEVKEGENLIKLLRKDSNKINAYILCGKLRSAYLMAVRAERVEDVQRIAGAAQRMGQTAVKTICNKWLEQRKS